MKIFLMSLGVLTLRKIQSSTSTLCLVWDLILAHNKCSHSKFLHNQVCQSVYRLKLLDLRQQINLYYGGFISSSDFCHVSTQYCTKVPGQLGLSMQSVILQLQITFLFLFYSVDHVTEQCLSNLSFAHKLCSE